MKAVLFSTQTGGGHRAAGEAVAQALEKLGVTALRVDSLALAGEQTSRTVERTYVSVARHYPGFFGQIYRAGQWISTPRAKSIVYWANTLYASRMADYLAKEQPDLIVCSHIFSAQTLTHLRNHQACPASYTAGVMTDYTCAPFWEETRMDAYFTPHRDLEDVFCKHGMPRDRLFPEGIPVSPECAVPIDTRAEKVAQGLPPDAKHVMIVGGSMGAGDLPDVLQQLAALPKEVYLTIICGNNESLRAQLAARFAGQARIRVCGYVSPLYTAMRSADVLVSKPGGLTTTEAMAQRIPMVLVNPIAGVETLNAAFFAARGLALYAKHVEEMLPLTRRLLYDADAMAKMRICQQKEIPCDASMRIARFLMQQVALRGKGREA